MAAALRDGLLALDIPASSGQRDTLLRYIALLARWNRAYNLTAIRAPRDMVRRHLLDSATALPWLHGLSVLDAGSGAGLPGLVLAVLAPRRQFTLLDSAGKKIRFLRHVVAELRLANVTVVRQRAEAHEPGQPYDTVICRAFADLAGFVHSCGSLAAAGGRLVAMKGRYPEAELAALPAGWPAGEVARVQVPGLERQRHIVVLERLDD
ncbi:MAG: 16S rRNA (guanine(527)-N(7))-methyltransferase RsmG [Gammaproteobacteria bacterium]|nr:MAG: 16S rRNA (guanine(527)-N(7))-methyltransferase RsmG [Gammaproteobacteria bacterium]